MTETNDIATDEDAFTRAAGRWKRRAWWGMTGFLVLGIVLGAASLRLPATVLGGHRTATLVVGIVVAVMAVSTGFALWLVRGLRDLRLDRALSHRRDALQRNRSIAVLVSSVYMVAMSPLLWRTAGDLMRGGASLRGYVLLAGLCGFLLLGVALIFDPTRRQMQALFDDEFSRSLRIRALLIAAGALFLGAAGLFLFGMTDPARAVQAIPLLLLYTIVIFCAVYAILDLKADRA